MASESRVTEIHLEMSGKHSCETQKCKHWEAPGPVPLWGLLEELLQMPAQLQASGPGPFPPGFVLLNPPPPSSVACLAAYTGRSPGFQSNRSGKLYPKLFCQLILWGMALNVLGKSNGRREFSSQTHFPLLVPCTDNVSRPCLQTWVPVTTALPGLPPTALSL